MIFDKIKKYNNNVSLIVEDSQISYQKLINSADEVSKKFKKKSLVFFKGENDLESIIAYVGLVNANCTLLMIDTNINELSLFDLYEKYQPDYFFCKKKIIDLKFIKENFKIITSFKNYILIKKTNPQFNQINDNLMLLLPTSGSLGSPKYVKLSYENIYNNTNAISKYLDIDENDRTITSMPMVYSYGLSNINIHLFKGGSIVINNKSLFDKNFWILLNNSKINNFSGVPYHYEILNKIGLDKILTNKIKFITHAGGQLNSKLTEKILDICLELNIRFFTMYGQTEASPRMSYLELTKNISKIGSIGKPLIGGEFWIEGEKEKITEPNKVGELNYKGKNVYIGYSNNFHDLKSNENINNILKTGDLAKFDEDNFWYIEGRKKRIIKIYGERLNLDFMEEKLIDNNYSCVCLEKNNSLFIVSEKNIEKKEISKVLSILANRFEFVKINKFPRSKNGKIQYKELLKKI